MIPYFFQIEKNVYTGNAERGKLSDTILEDIAENMTYAFPEKQSDLKTIKVMYFEKCWNVFDILKEKDELMKLYNEKYNHFYIESESESDDDECSYSDDECSYSDDSDDIDEILFPKLFEEARKKVYDCHIKLMERGEPEC